MKPFIRRTALALAVLFLGGAALAWIELLKEGDILSNPRLKAASGWLTTGVMLLALGVRGWRFRPRDVKLQRRDDPPKERTEGNPPL